MFSFECIVSFTSYNLLHHIQVCWVSNTYHVPIEDVIPGDPDDRQERQLTYYQWVPFILLFMGLVFKLPRIAWKVLTFSTSVSLDKVRPLNLRKGKFYCVMHRSAKFQTPPNVVELL